MSEVSVAQAAELLGVGPARIRQMAAAGRIPARKVGRDWLIDARGLRGPATVSRPMSERMAWALLMLSGGEPAPWVSPTERSRIRRQLRRLADTPDPVALVSSWLASRASRLELASTNPESLLGDRRVRPAGVNDSRSGIFWTVLGEVYVHRDDLATVRAEHGLTPRTGDSRDIDVLVRSVPMLPEHLPDLAIVADLADYGPGREYARAGEILETLSWQ